MRHNPAAGALVTMLRSLMMYGMAQAVTDLIEQGTPAFEAAIPMLSQLLKAELAEREVRSIAYHMESARRHGPWTNGGTMSAPGLQGPRRLRLHSQ